MSGPITRATIRTGIVLAGRLVLQAGTLLLVARLLGATQYGVFVAVASLAVLLGTLSTCGTHLALLGVMANAPERRAEVLGYAVPLTLTGGILLLPIYGAIGMWLLQRQALAVADAVLLLLGIGVTELLLQPLLTLITCAQLGMGRIAQSQLLTNAPLALRLVLVLVLLLFPLGAPMNLLAIGYAVASVIVLFAIKWVQGGELPGIQQWRWPDRAQLRHAAGFATIGLTASGPAELDKALSVRLLSGVEAGVYSAGARVVGATTLPVVALTLAALPRLFRESTGKEQHAARLKRWLSLATLMYSACLASVLWLAAPWLAALFGASYSGMDVVIRDLCWAVPAMALRMLFGSMLMTTARPWVRSIFEVVGVLVMVVAAIALAGAIGMRGMPWAIVCSEWAMALAAWYLVRNAQHQINS